MNKQYIVDEKGNVKIRNNEDNEIEYGKANIFISEILSLENYQEQTQQKIEYFNEKIKEFSKNIHIKNKNNRTFNIMITIIITTLLIISAAININIALIVFLSIIPLSIIIETIENKLLSKNREENHYYTQRLNEETYKLNKIKSKIERLKKDKRITASTKKYIDVLPINTYNLNSEDYFIESYQIEKRAREMTKAEPKKLVRKNNRNNLYKI